MDFSVFQDIAFRRRSFYPEQFSQTPISKETIDGLLALAQTAPSHKKTFPWRFKVFHSAASRAALSEYLSAWYMNNTPEAQQSPIKLKKNTNKPLLSGAVIAICWHKDTEARLPEWEEVAAIACSVQNIWLGVSALGLGGYWSTPSSIKDIHTFLGLKPNEECLGFFYLGHLAQAPEQRTWPDLSENTTWID